MEGDCIPDINGQGVFVDMGQYRSSDFLNVGDLANRTVKFDIRLNGCSGTVSNLVKVAFRGVTDRYFPEAFEARSINSEKENSRESGIGLVIFDRNNNALRPNALPVSAYNLTGRENNTLTLTARYQKTADAIIPGDLKTTIWFDLIYP
ncbi:fimbrial protein [Salmonella enterica subsp. enterica serovar Choleraesuis]|nr:fimbrial protein [Salmonella enterica subsp. enterica serovar Choleraesuis]